MIFSLSIDILEKKNINRNLKNITKIIDKNEYIFLQNYQLFIFKLLYININTYKFIFINKL